MFDFLTTTGVKQGEAVLATLDAGDGYRYMVCFSPSGAEDNPNGRIMGCGFFAPDSVSGVSELPVAYVEIK